MKRGWKALQGLLAAVIVGAAAWLLWQRVRELSPEQLRAAWHAAPAAGIAWSLLATAASFACLAAYEWFAVQRVVPGQLRAATVVRIGLLAHAIANTLGLHALTATAFRYQQYQRFGLGLPQVARIVAWVATCVLAGVVLLAVAALAWLQFGESVVASAIAVAITALLGWLLRRQFVLYTTGTGGSLPQPGQALLLAVVALLEMTAAVTALYVLLPAQGLPSPAYLALVIIGATLLGIASHSPGGIGVFEAAVLSAMPTASGAGVLLALLLYRAIYNLLPFLLAVLALAAMHLRRPADGSIDRLVS